MNPVPVNSANIGNFGFSSLFKIADKQLVFSLVGFTTYVNSGQANVSGVCFKVVDPSGLVLHDIDFTAPDIVPSVGTPFTLILPNGLFLYGWWQLTGQIKDQDGTITTLVINTNICEPDGIQNGKMPGLFLANVDCVAPSIKVSESTALTYKSNAPYLVAKSGNLYYPQGILSPVAFTSTPFVVSGTNAIYTGDYLIVNTTTADYDNKDGVTVELKYFTNLTFSVDCNSNLASIICCITAVQDIYEQWPNTDRGRNAKQQLDKIGPYLNLALCNELIGQSSNDQIATIADILGCDCNCNGQLVQPQVVGASQSIVIAPGCGIGVSAATVGSTTTFTIAGQQSVVRAPMDELTFEIVPVTVGCVTTYTIDFNFDALAGQMLESIKEDGSLSSILNSIIDSTLFADQLSAFDGDCIIDLSKADYVTVLPINPAAVQVVKSLYINGAERAAPGGLAITNDTGVASWLNTLGLGSFTASYDSGTSTLTIQSLQNTFKVSTATVTTTVGGIGSDKVFLFSSTNKNLPQLLQAIYDYVCAINSSQITFGVDALQQYSYNSDFSINKITIDSAAKLSSVITNLITAQQSLFLHLNDIGFTCINVQKVFGTVDLTVLNTDGVLATKGGMCAFVTYGELFQIMLTQAATNATIQGLLCGLTSGCAGSVCPPVTNVSAVFVSGTLTVNCNGAGGTTPIQIRYRINNSGLTFTEVDTTAASLPIAIGAGALVANQYEVQVRQQCQPSGVFSAWVPAVSNNSCAAPVVFSVAISGANFVVSGTLSGSQTKIEVIMTDPNGGQSTYVNDFGGVSGTFNISIPNIVGNFSFIARAICDNTVTPVFASAYTNPVGITVTSGIVNNFFASPGYGFSFTDISGGTATGLPPDLAGLTITGTVSRYAAHIVAGTISVTLAGSLGPPSAHLKLVKNNTTVLQSINITGPGTNTLTLGADLVAPDVLSIELDTP